MARSRPASIKGKTAEALSAAPSCISGRIRRKWRDLEVHPESIQVHGAIIAVLCEFAERFPRELAGLLDRDLHLTRNFREETATDLLMMGLVPFEPLGIRVDFPDEVVTGADMDWIYAAPHEVGGGEYLRLLIQAKRCKEQKLKDGSSYWYYDHLDHGDPKGSQAATLVAHAATSPDGMDTLPLYMFYHPRSALQSALPHRPAVEGVNVRLARDVAGVVSGGCGREEKRVGYWRDGFMSLSDLLCWPVMPAPSPTPLPRADATEFLSRAGASPAVYASVAFHPELVADRINNARRAPIVREDDGVPARPSRGLPDEIRRSIDGKGTPDDRKRLARPRVILSTPLTREDPLFQDARENARRRRRI